MVGDTGVIWVQTMDDAHLEEVTGEDENTKLGREVLWQSFHGQYRGNVRRPTVPHHIKYGGGHGHRDTLVAGKTEGTEGFGMAVQTLYALFYEDDRLLNSPRLASLKVVLDVMTGLFDYVGI